MSKPRADRHGPNASTLDVDVRSSTPLIDGVEKVTGQATYAADVSIPGMLHARLVLSPHAHARILAIDASKAKALRGVVEVVTAADLPANDARPSSRSHVLLATDRAVFQGHPVAAVLAEDESTACDAVGLIVVDYEPLPAVVDPVRAMERDAPLVWPLGLQADWAEAAAHGGDAASAPPGDAKQPAGNISGTVRYTHGDTEVGFADSDFILESSYTTSAIHQGYLEPHAGAAHYDRASRELTVWTGTQGSFLVRTVVAKVLGLPERRVRIIPMTLGGGFGGKIVLLEPLIGALAMKVGRPVRLVLSRTEDFQTSTPSPQAVFELKMGAKANGRLMALKARVVFDSGAFPGSPMPLACLAVAWSYKFPYLDIEGVEVLTHKAAAGAYRAPGAPAAIFAAESHVDELARVMKIDPVEFRLQNLIGDTDARPDGSRWPPMGLKACLERLRQSPRWTTRTRGANEGYGIAISPWRGAIEPAAALCRIDEDGALCVIVGSVDITGAHTSLAIIAAKTFGLPIDLVRVVSGDTSYAPYAGISGGSKTTYTVGGAVQAAVADAKRQLAHIAASLMEARTEDIEIDGSWVHVRGVPERRRSISEIARSIMQPGSQHAPILGRGLEVPKDRASGSAVHLAHVAVDPETGQVRVADYLAIQDVGFAINPAAVRGQIHGGVTQGLGLALNERLVYTEEGQLVTGSLADYGLPSAPLTPRVDVELVEVPLSYTPLGARGVGEPPIVPVAAAVANAIRDATGVRPYGLPMTSRILLQMLADKRRDESNTM